MEPRTRATGISRLRKVREVSIGRAIVARSLLGDAIALPTSNGAKSGGGRDFLLGKPPGLWTRM